MKAICNKIQLPCLSRVWSILWRLIYVYQDYSHIIFFTQGALIWFLPSISIHMRVKITCPWKCFITLGALIWFLPSMSHHMPVKTTLPWKCCIIQGALIGFLPGMSHHMFIKTTLHWFFFHTGFIDMVSFLYESTHAGLDYLSMKMLSHGVLTHNQLLAKTNSCSRKPIFSLVNLFLIGQ